MRFGLTLSLAEFRPEAGTCVGAPAALLIGPHGEGTASFPQRGPEVSERLTQTVTHPRSSTRRRGGATRLWLAGGTAGTPTSHDRGFDLLAGDAGDLAVVAAARVMGPAIRSLPRAGRTGAGHERSSAG